MAINSEILKELVERELARTLDSGRIASRTVGNLVGHAPLTMTALVKRAVPYPLFAAVRQAVPVLRAQVWCGRVHQVLASILGYTQHIWCLSTLFSTHQ